MKNFLVFTLIFIFFFSFSQVPKLKIKPLEVKNEQDFNFLKEEIKDAQAVLLGENTHFDGNVFEAKTKIVEYLVNEMGFNTIAFESGIYDLWKAQESIKNGTDTKNVFQNSLFSIWGKRKEFQSFIDFFDQNKTHLNLFGFDYQVTGTNGTQNLSTDLFQYAKQIKFKFSYKEEDFQLLLESITTSGMFDEEDIDFESFENNLSDLLTKIEKQPNSESQFYWKQIVQGLLSLGKDSYSRQEILSSYNVTSVDNIRDKQMADNLLAYLKQNPDAKVICWGANSHFANNITSISEPILKEFVPMGSFIKNELKEKAYSLAVVTAEDSIFIQNKWHKTPIKENSFEDFLRKSNYEHAFISSNQIENKSVYQNRLFSPITFVKSDLKELHDGYLYFRNVYPSTVISSEIEVSHTIENSEVEESFLDFNDETSLNEVIVYGKRSAYQIIEKAIQTFNQNYPRIDFTSTMQTAIQCKVSDSLILDCNVLANQYDLGYVNHTNRNTKQIKDVSWRLSEEWEPKSLQEFHGLMYNNPIQYAPLLKGNKFKKFVLTIEETKHYKGNEVYVISFSTTRQHSAFTRRVYLSEYSGYLYVNKSDFAIVKLFENWKVVEFPVSFREGYDFKKQLKKYSAKEYLNESTITDFEKKENHYVISHSINVINGKLYNDLNENTSYELTVETNWTDFNFEKVVPIKSKDEKLLFHKF